MVCITMATETKIQASEWEDIVVTNGKTSGKNSRNQEGT